MHVEIQSVMRVQSFKKFFECLPLPFICFENIERELNNNGSNLIKKISKIVFQSRQKGRHMSFKKNLSVTIFEKTFSLLSVHLITH